MSPHRRLALALCVGSLPFVAAAAAEAAPSNYLVPGPPSRPIATGLLTVVPAQDPGTGSDVLMATGDEDGSRLVSFRDTDAYPVRYGTRAVATGDLDGDGRPEVVTAGYDDRFPNQDAYNGLSILTFDPSTSTYRRRDVQHVVYHPSNLTLGDVNGDGRTDIVLVSAEVTEISVMLQRADGSFSRTDFDDPIAYRVQLGDVNGDGRTDIITNGTPITAYVQASDGSFTKRRIADPSAPTTSPGDGQGLVAGDFDGDGDTDIAAFARGASSEQQVVLLRQGPAGQWRASRASVPESASVIRPGDFDGDGRLDLVVGSISPGPEQPGSVSVVLQRPDGSLVPQASRDVPSLWDIAVTDLDQDGHLDVVVAGNEQVSPLFGALDVVPPTTLDDVRGATTTLPRRVTLLSADDDSGVARTTFEIIAADGTVGPTQTYSSLPGLRPGLAEGERLRYRSIDVAGNVEPDRESAVVRSAPPAQTTPAQTTPTTPAQTTPAETTTPVPTETTPAPPAETTTTTPQTTAAAPTQTTTETTPAPPTEASTTATTATAPPPVTGEAASVSPTPSATPSPAPTTRPEATRTPPPVVCRAAGATTARIAVKRPTGRLTGVRASLGGKRLAVTRTRTSLVVRVDLRGRTSGPLRVTFVVRRANGPRVTITAAATYRRACA